MSLTDVEADERLYAAFMLGFQQGQATSLEMVLTVNEAAAYAGVARNTIIAWLDRGELIYREKINGFLIYKPSLYAKMVKKGLIKP